jgi:copper chaperone CopZ
MKYVILLSVLVGSFLFSGCRETDVREMTIQVPGMAADADVQRIRKALAPLNGVNREQAVFDVKDKKIVLTYDSMVIAKKNIEIAIAEAGYDANAIAAIKPGPAK